MAYVVAARGNPVYGGRFGLHGRYRTYGQHSFIYDLVAALARRRADCRVVVDGLDQFPISGLLRRHCPVAAFSSADLGEVAFAVLDAVDDALLARLPAGLPVIQLLHDAFAPLSAATVARVQAVVSMTETAYAHQAATVPPDKLVLLHQGVDLRRFRLRAPLSPIPATARRVLVYSRLEPPKLRAIAAVTDRLVKAGHHVTVLGDGEGFWPLCDRLGDAATMMNFVPCSAMHRLLPQFDLVVSSGRGVMEALACGVPALCAGFQYAGPVLPSNIEALRRANLTGVGAAAPLDAVDLHIRAASSVASRALRGLAERHFDVDAFAGGLLSLGAKRPSAAAPVAS